MGDQWAQHDAKYFWKPFVWALPIFLSLYSLPPLFNNSCNKSCGVGWKSAYHNYHCWNKWCESTRLWYQVSYWHKHLCMLMHDLDRAVVRLSGAYGISWKSSFCMLLMNSVCDNYCSASTICTYYIIIHHQSVTISIHAYYIIIHHIYHQLMVVKCRTLAWNDA